VPAGDLRSHGLRFGLLFGDACLGSLTSKSAADEGGRLDFIVRPFMPPDRKNSMNLFPYFILLLRAMLLLLLLVPMISKKVTWPRTSPIRTRLLAKAVELVLPSSSKQLIGTP
jgi:hypothetical protein